MTPPPDIQAATEDYVTAILDLESAWHPPIAPDCADPVWLRIWEEASPTTRNSLAHAWLWHFDSYGGEDYWRTVGQQVRLIGEIAKHVRTRQRNCAPSIKLFTKKFQLADTFFQTSRIAGSVPAMWFGEPLEKLAALAATRSAVQPRDLGVLSDLAHDIAWWVLDTCEAKTVHKRAAINISILSGAWSLKPNREHPEAQYWWELGYLLSTARQVPTISGDYLGRLEELKNFARAQDPALMAPLLSRLFSEHPYRSTLTVDLGRTAVSIHQQKDALGYGFLRHWVPAYETRFTIFESVGVGYVEAAAQLGREADDVLPLPLPQVC